jgi:hypothetical protein
MFSCLMNVWVFCTTMCVRLLGLAPLR